MMNHLVSEIVSHVQLSPLGGLYTKDGTPDVSAIKRLFHNIDIDKDNYISQSELKNLIMDVDFGKITWDVDAAVAKAMEDLDKSGDHLIDEEEFISGFIKWLNTSANQAPNSPEPTENVFQKPWEEAELLVEKKMDKSLWAWVKAIMLLVLGIAMLGILAEPLIQNVHKFSASAKVPSFLVSFILVPVATNARAATSAIKSARRRKLRTTSLAFSEIVYNGVFVNNILEFFVLLSVIYFRGLSWHFSAEVAAVLSVCSIVGIAGSLRSNFPIWTSVLAFLLYPSSLILVYVLDGFFWVS